MKTKLRRILIAMNRFRARECSPTDWQAVALWLDDEIRALQGKPAKSEAA
jgi:hypothetical protein